MPAPVERIPLGDAGAVSFTVTAEGARVVDVDATAGWRLRRRAPKGLLRRHRPAPYVSLSLTQGIDPADRLWELALERLEDGTWSLAVLQARPCRADEAVDTPGGRLRTAVVGGVLTIAEADPSPGHEVHVLGGSDEEVVVVFTRAGAAVGREEEWEVVVRLGDHDRAPARLEIDHRRPYQPLLG